MPRSEHAATPSGLSTPQHGHVPHGNANVWRYMNTWKFEQLLKTRALYFANANQLTDQYEVCVPEAVLAKKRQSLIQQGLKDHQLVMLWLHFIGLIARKKRMFISIVGRLALMSPMPFGKFI